ncbi:MAG: hypothetical protein K2X60_08890 [Xanthobacteraceae bacterium]|nr:hypothetical protein [Xanthobacteraceae bacterium]
MDVRFTSAQAFFGIVFGAVVAHLFNGEWWTYVLAMSAIGGLAYYTAQDGSARST